MKYYLLFLTLIGTVGIVPISNAQQTINGQQTVSTGAGILPVIADCTSTSCTFTNQGVKTCTNSSQCGGINTSLQCSGNSSCVTFGSGIATCAANNQGFCKTIPFFSLNQCQFAPGSNRRLNCPYGVVLILPSV